MQELTEIDSPGAHVCLAPRAERWRVYEPGSGDWCWFTVFQCCNLVWDENAGARALVSAATPPTEMRQAA